MTGDVQPTLHWEAKDIERRLGIRAAKYTGTNTLLTLVIGVLLAIAFYVSLVPFTGYHFGQMFYERGVVPYAIVFLTAWSLAILLVKWLKLRVQRDALEVKIIPEGPDFVLTPLTADDILKRIYVIADNPKRFVLLNRITRALSNLRNIGRVSDVDDILRSQAENDENYVESTYTLVRGFIWAIPVLGFIGTVIGLSYAIGGFGAVLTSASEIGELRNALQGVTGGLAVAFETTLIGLVAAVFIQLLLTALRRQEEAFLDECMDYCHSHIVTRLRTIPVHENAQIEGAP